MRIIAGRWRGTRLATPEGETTRPTAGRAREAVFSMLESGRFDHPVHGNPLAAAVVADVFAGSGALGLEAVSRGAGRGMRQVLFLEQDKTALAVLDANIKRLRLGDAAAVLAVDATAPLRWPAAAAGLFLIDPPWQHSAAAPDLADLALQRLLAAGAIASGALVVLEHDKRFPPAGSCGFSLLESRSWGRIGCSFLRHEKG